VGGDHGTRLDAPDSAGLTPLARAVAAGHLGSVRRLLRGGADPMARLEGGVLALHLAADTGHAEMLAEVYPPSPTRALSG
jgi:ankyrin repeat protein